MDCQTSEDASREWKKNFSFLKITGLECLYLGILAMATSKTSVFDLHHFLQADEQLLRDDLIKLAEFWEKYIKPKDKHYTAKDWLFYMLGGDRNNTRYYLDYIRSKRLELQNDDKPNFDCGDLVLSSRLRGGTVQFLATLIYPKTSQPFCTVGIECYVSKNKKRLIVKLITYSNKLIEPLTYFLSNLPSYAMFADSCGQHGSEIDLSYSFEAEGLEDKLTPHTNPNAPDLQYYIGGDEFVTALEERLRKHGIPVGIIYEPYGFNRL